MLTVCVPNADAAEALADESDLRVLVWNGEGDAPDGVEDTEFLLGEYMGGALAENAIARMPKLRAIQVLSAGVEPWLPLVPDGVTLCNGRGVHGVATAELAVAGLLTMFRELPSYAREQRAGRWAPQPGDDLDDKRVLILGAGEIGRTVANALAAFGARSTFVARTARDGIHAVDELPTLLPDHQIVVVSLPHTDETHHLLDAGALAAMPDGALLVNVARGSIVVTDALLPELTSGRLRAFLDVTDPEPLPEDHPLWHAPNVVITPHVGGGTSGWKRRGYRLVRAQLTRLAAGEELENVVGATY